MVDPVKVEEGKNSSQKEQGTSSRIACNMRLRQKRLGAMTRPEVTLCVSAGGSNNSLLSLQGLSNQQSCASLSPGCSEVTLILLQSGGVSPEIPGALHLHT